MLTHCQLYMTKGESMLFYRSGAPASPISVSSARIISLATLVAYPLGALVLRSSGTASQSLLGYVLILAALIFVAFLIKSSLQRIVAEVPSKLDEFELGLRSRAMNLSYAIFTAITLLGIVYAAIASNHGVWVPTTYEDFNGLFWGVFLYAVIIPVAVLSWIVDPSFETER